MIELGNRVRDIVTGFEGIAVARVEYLNGCVQYCVTPAAKDNVRPAGEYIDVQQLEVAGEGVKVTQRPTGGTMPNTPSDRYLG